MTPRRPLYLRPLLSLLALAPLACGGSVSPTPPADGPLDGFVVDGAGLPISGATVLVGGAVFTTGADGHFAVPYAPAAYDLALKTPQGYVYSYAGLSSRAPVVASFAELGPAVHRAHVDVRQAPNGGGVWSFGFTASGPGVRALPGLPGDSNVVWTGPSQVTLTAYAIVTNYGQSTSVSYAGFQRRDFVVNDGDQVAWTLDANLDPVASKTATVDVTTPQPGGSLMGELIAHTRDGARISVGTGGYDGSAAPTIAMPSIDGATFEFGVSWSAGGDTIGQTWGMALVSPGDHAKLVVPANATLVAPTGGSVVAPNTSFTWTPPGGGMSGVFLVPSGSCPFVFLASADGKATLPDLHALGVAWPSGATYTWQVYGCSARTMNALARVGPNVQTFFDGDVQRAWSYSASRTITMQP